MKNLKRHSEQLINEVKEILESRFDCIGRYDAIKFIKKQIDSYIQIKTINVAYTRIDKFN